jgi:ectoine hydroxylase-related dioxygenase (phytanoyl-CoA dioxygenase family)
MNSLECRATAAQRRQLDAEGWVLIPDVLSSRECDELARRLDDAWEADRFQPHDYTPEPGVCFVQNIFRHSEAFEACVTDPTVLDAVVVVLGSDIVLSTLNGRNPTPGYGNQPLHDLHRRRGKPFRWCDVVWCVDEFTEANGPRVLPGSHLSDDRYLARLEDPLAPHPDQLMIAAMRGSAVVFNAALIHAGSTNETDAPRRSVQGQFVRSEMPPAYDWSAPPASLRAGALPPSAHYPRPRRQLIFD